jgi:hypothetical protein
MLPGRRFERFARPQFATCRCRPDLVSASISMMTDSSASAATGGSEASMPYRGGRPDPEMLFDA